MDDLDFELSTGGGLAPGGGLTPEELAGLAAGEDAEVMESKAHSPFPDSPEEETENILVNPVTGEIVNLDDIDSLIRGSEDIKGQIADLRAMHETLRKHAWGLTEEILKETGGKPTKTRRLRGSQFTAKLEQGETYPDQHALKAAWNDFPEIAPQFLKIGSISPIMKEVKKLEATQSADEKFLQFKRIVEAAFENASHGTPTLSLEK